MYIKYVEIGCTLVSLATYDSLAWTLKDLDGIGKECKKKCKIRYQFITKMSTQNVTLQVRMKLDNFRNWMRETLKIGNNFKGNLIPLFTLIHELPK